LPFKNHTRCLVMVNLTTAKALGLTIPALLADADEMTK
jgi:hypothetical protein